jgi:hypothetical protein
MRFLGKWVNQDGAVPANFIHEVTTDVKRRAEGVRIKHRMGENSIKLYDKASHTHRYQVTENGRLVLNAILSARHATVNQLIGKAA